MPKNPTKGFTLIEAAVAIAVVAILSGIIIPLVVKNLRDSQIARAKNDVQVIAAAIASQLKDTGGRPRAAGGFGGATGAAQSTWGSATAAVPNTTGMTAPAAGNTFQNLFSVASGNVLNNTMFGTVANAEFSYRGPYMADDVALKTDPWGNRYYILGYNLTSGTANGPIWVVCAGPDKTTALPAIVAGAYAGVWPAGAVNLDDLVVRVN